MNSAGRHHIATLLISALLLCGISVQAYGQTSPALLDYPQNHLPWFTIESEHFLVHYQEGSYAGAVSVLNAAENVYHPITGLYQFEPDGKLSIVIRDREDYSNGAAFFFDNKMEIWLPALDTPFRGTHSWIENVVAHELTHMIQLGASMKRSRHLPAIYFQWLSYENVRRPDVLYGFPNGIVTLPSSATSVPAWFAEGTAQYISKSISHDRWDSHRDMLLRTRILDGSELELTEMAVFSSKNSLERELVYNQGYSFVKYLTGLFGDEIVMQISSESSEGLGNFHNAINNATGSSAADLYTSWLEQKRSEYRKQLAGRTLSEPDMVESDGFLNFYPQFSSESGRLAYLTNRGREFSRTALVIRDGDRFIHVDDSGNPENAEAPESRFTLHGTPSPFSIDYIGNRFSFSPEGGRILYSRAEKNQFGELYQDLYIYDTGTENIRQLTFDQRIQDPAWHPDGNRIAAVMQKAGTQNLVLLNTDGSDIRPVTDFSGFETVYTPVWHPDGSTIYFSAAGEGSRNLFSIREPFVQAEAVFASDKVDIRDPWVSADGEFLYFSADLNGIFNIYRMSLADGSTEQLTDVTGGAFMPHVYDDTLYFSDYRSDGYKISRLPLADGEMVDLQDFLPQISAGSENVFSSANSASSGKPDPVAISEKRPYEQTTTGLSVFPVIRFDNYTKLKGSNRTLLSQGEFGRLGENLIRDVKLGVYLSSRDVTERLSLFGGLLIGPGSIPADGVSGFFSPNRINNLDRDLFLIAEHRGLPFIRRSWSPTVSLELYNLKRNVRNGLVIEEFPCTSCLPADRGIDIRYSVWEASLWFKSKLNRWSAAELGVTYSPYSVQTEGFFSNEFNEFIPGSTSEYFRATTYTASYTASLFEPYKHSDIAPKGIGGTIAYRLQPGSLLNNFELDDGILSPVYEKTVNHSVEMKGRFGFGISGRTTGLIQSRAFTYLNSPSDFFYLDYTGGLAGMRSYPYFAIGGRTTAFMTGSLIFPVRTGIFKQAGANTIDKLFLRLFAETGNGWGGPLNIGNSLKSGAGAELRLSFSRNYIFPMKFFLNGSYGFNRFEIEFPSEFINTDSGNTSKYGGEFLFYIGFTFDFDSL